MEAANRDSEIWIWIEAKTQRVGHCVLMEQCPYVGAHVGGAVDVIYNIGLSKVDREWRGFGCDAKPLRRGEDRAEEWK
jgi:hypothetical protein